MKAMKEKFQELYDEARAIVKGKDSLNERYCCADLYTLEVFPRKTMTIQKLCEESRQPKVQGSLQSSNAASHKRDMASSKCNLPTCTTIKLSD